MDRFRLGLTVQESAICLAAVAVSFCAGCMAAEYVKGYFGCVHNRGTSCAAAHQQVAATIGLRQAPLLALPSYPVEPEVLPRASNNDATILQKLHQIHFHFAVAKEGYHALQTPCRRRALAALRKAEEEFNDLVRMFKPDWPPECSSSDSDVGSDPPDRSMSVFSDDD